MMHTIMEIIHDDSMMLESNIEVKNGTMCSEKFNGESTEEQLFWGHLSHNLIIFLISILISI